MSVAGKYYNNIMHINRYLNSAIADVNIKANLYETTLIMSPSSHCAVRRPTRFYEIIFWNAESKTSKMIDAQPGVWCGHTCAKLNFGSVFIKSDRFLFGQLEYGHATSGDIWWI